MVRDVVGQVDTTEWNEVEPASDIHQLDDLVEDPGYLVTAGPVAEADVDVLGFLHRSIWHALLLVAVVGLQSRDQLVSFDLEASVLRCSHLDSEDVLKLDFSAILGLHLASRDQVSEGLVSEGIEEVVVELTDDHEGQEVHDDIQNGVVCHENDQVDDLDEEDD